MIFVRDKGQMCNNILQYGHLYAWGREHGRHAVSLRFAYKYPFFHICNTRYHNFWIYTLAKYAGNWNLIPKVEFHEPDADISKQEYIMRHSPFVVAEGWYVRFYDLFLKYKKEIIHLFAFTKKINGVVDRYLSKYGDSKSIRLGVHIRRGDYKHWMDGKYYYEDDVYIRNIKDFVKKFRGEKIDIYICGNDHNLNVHRYKKEIPEACLHFPKGSAGEDLCLLSRCNYLIGPPSTFSLVASMYHDAPLYWIENGKTSLTPDNFKSFDYLFQHIK